jgi:hypothetical protein
MLTTTDLDVTIQALWDIWALPDDGLAQELARDCLVRIGA